jgi:hypothetical protein
LPIFVLFFSNVAEIPQLATMAYHTLDGNLFRLDAQLGQPSWSLGSFLFSHPWPHAFINIWYLAEGLGMVAITTPEARHPKRVGAFLWALIGTGLLGFLIYNMIPAVGPVYAYQNFPSLSSAKLTVTELIRYPRNSFPSLHMAWAVLMLLHARRCWTKWLAWLFIVFTIVATLGLGEHYVVDLFIAVPFAVFANEAATAQRFAWGAGILTVLWIAMARYADAMPAESCPAMALVTLAWMVVMTDRYVRFRAHTCC